MASEITLTIPSGREFRDVAHFVLGGLASRLQLTVDHLPSREGAGWIRFAKARAVEAVS